MGCNALLASQDIDAKGRNEEVLGGRKLRIAEGERAQSRAR